MIKGKIREGIKKYGPGEVKGPANTQNRGLSQESFEQRSKEAGRFYNRLMARLGEICRDSGSILKQEADGINYCFADNGEEPRFCDYYDPKSRQCLYGKSQEPAKPNYKKEGLASLV